MAITVEFEGYVGEAKEFSWGTVIKVAHSQRAKNEATGEWETVGKDYFDVSIPAGLDVPAEKSIVRVRGTLKVGTYDKRDGGVGIALKVRAQDIEAVQRGGRQDPVDTIKSVLGAEPVDTELPF